MPKIVLGLDIGGANLKAATSAGRAVSVAFPLWKQPDKLAAALATLIAEFPESTELAVTMTGELCDCFATKREGVAFILDALPTGLPAKVWSTDYRFVDVDEAKAKPLAVAAANWHALATFAGRFAPVGDALLVDIGSTTTDIILLDHGVPCPSALTDYDRLRTMELFYSGVKRTPVCAVYTEGTCAEFFAEIRDVNILLGLVPESEETDTADGRPATWENSMARLARMFGGDAETLTEDFVLESAMRIHARQVKTIADAITRILVLSDRTVDDLKSVLFSGSGEWLAAKAFEKAFPDHGAKRISLGETLGPMVSSCSPAYAVAVLASEETA